MDRYRYGLLRITPPAIEPVTLDELRRNASVDGTTYHDPTLKDVLTEAREYCEDMTSSSLITTTWRMAFDRFPKSDRLYLPRWPLQSIEAIRYIDAAGDEQELDLDTISARIDHAGQGRIVRKSYASWPDTALTPDAVTIEFNAGFGDDPALVPSGWKRAIKMLATWWFEQREAALVGSVSNSVPLGVDALLESVASVDGLVPFDLGE